MTGNDLNLFDAIHGYIGGNFIERMAAMLGENQDKTRLGINAAVPGLIEGLRETSSTGDGVRRLVIAVDGADEDLLGNVSNMFSQGGRFAMDQGSDILRTILGVGALSALTGSVGKSSGLSSRGVTTILGMLVPIALAVLKKEKRARGLDSIGLSRLLATQRDNMTATTAGTREGNYEFPRAAASRTENYDAEPEKEKHRAESWIVPVAILAGCLGLLWYWASRPKSEMSFKPPTTVHAEREGITDQRNYGTATSFEKLKNKYRSVIDEARAQGVKISSMREENGKLIMEGTAPSREAADKVSAAIKRINPTQDDIVLKLQTTNLRSETPPSPTDTREKPALSKGGTQTYTVKEGDTLSTISKDFYGNSSDYMRIFNANKDKLTNRNMIEVGQKIMIPEK
jgi:LysM repeat protein